MSIVQQYKAYRVHMSGIGLPALQGDLPVSDQQLLGQCSQMAVFYCNEKYYNKIAAQKSNIAHNAIATQCPYQQVNYIWLFCFR